MHAALDLVGDVRDDLHRAAQVVAAALLGDDGVVDAAGGDVAVALHELVDEALVVAQVQVGLGAVLGDEDLAVLEGAHGAGVDVDVGVELLVGDLQAALLEQAPERGGRDALAETGHDTAGDEDVFGHGATPAGARGRTYRRRAERRGRVQRGSGPSRQWAGRSGLVWRGPLSHFGR